MTTDFVEAYTNSTCSGNPGPGGWGVLLRYKGVEQERFGGEPETTNNRMELMAAISALEALKRPMPIKIFTDSTYVRDGITKWIHGWKRNGWRTSDRAHRTKTSGAASTPPSAGTPSSGTGSKATPATPRTSGPTSRAARDSVVLPSPA